MPLKWKKIITVSVITLLVGWLLAGLLIGGYHQAFPAQANPGFHQGYVGPSRSWDERFQPYPWILDYNHIWDI